MQTYYSSEALDMDQWAREENNRVKASRIFKAAQSLEQRYRDNHSPQLHCYPMVIRKHDIDSAGSPLIWIPITDYHDDPSPLIW
jgi:hypothetical protein